MQKDYINIDENEICDITNHFNKTQYLLMDSKNESSIKFQSLNRTKLFDNGIKKINKQVESISNAINKMNNKIKEKTNEIIAIDKRLSEEAEQIKVPMDFVTYNSVNTHTFNQILLSKQDGKNINKNNNLGDNKLIFDSTIRKKEINNINNSKEDMNNKNINDYTIKEELLKNIDNKSYINGINLYDDIEIKDEYFYDDFFDK